MTIAVPFILLVVFLLTGMPIAFALGVSGSVGLLMFGGLDTLLGVLQTTPFDSVDDFLMSAIPMFILMASLMKASGIMKDLFSAAYKWLCDFPGGLGIATVFDGSAMGAVLGSSTASAATMASAAYPEMKRYNYSSKFSMGIISISGTLAVMIPPSIVLIIYGITTETGVGQLLIAGIIPGVITALGYVATIVIRVKINPEIGPSIKEAASIKEKLSSLKSIWPTLVIVIIVMGGIYAGIVTPTEAGALGAFATFIVGLLMRKYSFKSIQEAFIDTLKSTTMILTIVIGAMIFGYFITITRVTQKLVTFIETQDIPSFAVLVCILIIFLVLGFFLDQIAILLIALPLTFPIITSLGFDPIWFGILVTKTVE